MIDRPSFIFPLLKLWSCFLVAESVSECFIKGDEAKCGQRKLNKVPVLPPYITHLDLSINYIREIHEKSFSGLEALQILLIQQQEVPLLLRNNSFSGLSDLTTLDLAYNTNLQMDPGAFDGLFNLQILNLTGCQLRDAVLSGDYLRPLVSLEQLLLRQNHLGKVRPASFFVNMSKLHTVDISENTIKSVCEEDLLHFQGKRFTVLNLSKIKLFDMNPYWRSWSVCGNPFKNMSMMELNLSLNGFSVDMAVLFFKAIRGTRITTLLLYHSIMGKGAWYNNQKDPDRNTFKDLAESGIRVLDLSKAKIFTLKNSVFSHMPDLQEISLSHNLINQIERNAFYRLDHLRTLNLSHNLLDKINSEMFKNLQRLEVLDLSNNNIRMIMSGSFQGLSSLVYLSLSENSLRHVNTLAHLPRLKQLFLDNNKMTSLYSLPSQVRNVTAIELGNNRISNAETFYVILVEFPDIRIISLRGNVLSWCFLNYDYFVSPSNSVQNVDLQMTGLQNLWLKGQCLDMFHHLHQLQVLYLQNNHMQSLPDNIFNGLTSLDFLDLSFNSLTYISNNIFPKSLRILKLAYNHLGSVDPQAFSSLTHIDLLGNLFLCDCSLSDFQTWLNQTDVQMASPIEELRCMFPVQHRGTPLLHANLCEDEEDEKRMEDLRLALFICSTVLVMLTITGAVMFVQLRGYCFQLYRKVVVRLVERDSVRPCNDRFTYDVYLCFSPKDIKWVTKALLKKLDVQFSDQNDLRCCFEARDFIPGEDHLSNIHNAICKSKKTLCVLSREFFNDGWCLEAFSLAQSVMLEQVKDVLLVLLVDKIPHYKLMKYEAVRTYFQTRRYFCWPEDSQDLEWFYHQLKKTILKNANVKQVKKDVGGNQKTTTCEAETAF